MKKIDRSAHTGDGGTVLIHQRVYAIGHGCHEGKTDAGIEGGSDRLALLRSRPAGRRR